MDRRAFLKSGVVFSTAAALPWREALADTAWRRFEITTRAELVKPQGLSQVWLPLPLVPDTDWHRNLGSQWSGNTARAEDACDADNTVHIPHVSGSGRDAT